MREAVKEHKQLYYGIMAFASLVVGLLSFAMFWFALSGTTNVSHVNRFSYIKCTPYSVAKVITENVPVPPTVNFTVEKAFYVNGLCEGIVSVMGNYQPVYIGKADNGKPYLITGVMWQDKRDVAKSMIEKLQTEKTKAMLGTLSHLAGFQVENNPSQPNKVVYFISDPQCPFCQMVKKPFFELAKQYGWNVKVVWYPIQTPNGSLHKGSKRIVEHFICSNQQLKDYLANNYDKSRTNICNKGLKETDNNIAKLQDFVQGTPTFVFPNGATVVGANLEQLKHIMAKF